MKEFRCVTTMRLRSPWNYSIRSLKKREQVVFSYYPYEQMMCPLTTLTRSQTTALKKGYTKEAFELVYSHKINFTLEICRQHWHDKTLLISQDNRQKHETEDRHTSAWNALFFMVLCGTKSKDRKKGRNKRKVDGKRRTMEHKRAQSGYLPCLPLKSHLEGGLALGALSI